jgi:chitinase
MTLEPGTAPRFEKQTEVGSYFTSWGIYGRNFKLKDFAAMAAADQVTFVNYAFGNLRQINGGYECGIINKPESGSGDGGDAWADFGRGFLADESVDGVRDEWDAKLAGNFNQLKVLKARFVEKDA